ncbi:hypothetical protein [Nocardia bovistercoris]|uniref:Uncharacterized protein n=1 Tax=Nocardia bovistercoris TaxID=2785916 RepID=A0A931ID97_9NOCA|nr:hypothetical protein [Nocardia bovistercoris]MBH0777715.1 hypothetical protein [Nocardia bovistercoris]
MVNPADTASPTRHPALPDIERLLMVWEHRDTPATEFERLSLLYRDTWTDYLTGMHILDVADWLDTDTPRPIDTTVAQLARTLDDHAALALGATPESVTLIEDESEEYTLGETIGRATMLAVLLDLWPDISEDVLARRFNWATRGYDLTLTHLHTGHARLLRRRSHRLPPPCISTETTPGESENETIRLHTT